MGDCKLWRQSGTHSLQGPIDGMEILEQPSCRKLAYWLAREASEGGGGAQGFARYGGPIE